MCDERVQPVSTESNQGDLLKAVWTKLSLSAVVVALSAEVVVISGLVGHSEASSGGASSSVATYTLADGAFQAAPENIRIQEGRKS